MGRFADPYGDTRLPEGMVRIGYDADTAQYYYSDRDGRVYESAPGAEYGLLLPVRRYYSGRENNDGRSLPLIRLHTTHLQGAA